MLEFRRGQELWIVSISGHFSLRPSVASVEAVTVTRIRDGVVYLGAGRLIEDDDMEVYDREGTYIGQCLPTKEDAEDWIKALAVWEMLAKHIAEIGRHRPPARSADLLEAARLLGVELEP